MKPEKRQEQEEWIKAHGSERLRKAMQLGMLTVCGGIYRDERVGEAYPDWFYGATAKFAPIINPTLDELEFLEKIRGLGEGNEFPDAVLEKMLRQDRWVSVVSVVRTVPALSEGHMWIYRYCSPMETFLHTGEIPARLRRPPKD